jgi:hypothetical protein
VILLLTASSYGADKIADTLIYNGAISGTDMTTIARNRCTAYGFACN